MSTDNNYNGSPSIPVEYTPISMWGYFGYELLFSIPCIGLIFLIIYAISAKNVNLRNFARSYFCYLILVLIVCAILGIAFSALGISGGLSNLEGLY